MNESLFNRDLLAHCLIIAAVVVGGWIMLVQPEAQELAELEAVIAESNSSDVPLTQTGIEILASRVELVKDRIGDVQNRNTLASDSSQLYSKVMDLGTQHGVLIERMRPGGDQRSINNGKATATRMDITLKGEYETVAKFIDDVVNLPGFVRPVSLTVNPARGDEQEVAVRLVCEALQFELPDELSMADGGGADVDS